MTPAQWRSFAKISLPLLALFSTAAYAAQVVSFYPTGSVKQVQQATVRFSSDMVAMGDPRSKVDPMIMTCNATTKKQPTDKERSTVAQKTPQYSTRWADSKNWVLEFDKPLPAGLRCSFQINPKAKDIAGAKIEGESEYSFSTAGPALLNVTPESGQIAPDQYFFAVTDGAIDSKSLTSIAYFEVAGMPDKVGVKIVEGPNRTEALKALEKSEWKFRRFKEALGENSSSSVATSDRLIVMTGARRFPDGAKVVLHWPKGILSKSGLSVEEPQSFKYQVMKEFSAKFSCQRSNSNRPCNPITDMSVEFTAALPLQSLLGAKLVAADGRTWVPNEVLEYEKSKSKGAAAIDAAKSEVVNQLRFKAPFPDSTQFKVILPTGLKDELDRPLVNQSSFPLEVATDEYLPLIKFSGDFGILELKADPVLPVSVRNVEKQMAIQQVSIEAKTLNLSNPKQISQIINLYLRVRSKLDYGSRRNRPVLSAKEGSKFQMPKPLGEREFELVGIPLKKPGFYVVEMASPRLGKALTGAAPMYVATAALVTDMAVHLKKGRESSLVWVTQLSNAKPVAGANVSLFSSSGEELGKGVTKADGTVRFGKIKYPCDFESKTYQDCEVFAFAHKGEDLSFSSDRWSDGIESYRFNVPTEYLAENWGPAVIHTVLDRVVAQAGDVVQMKHVLREHRERGFAMMSDKRLPKRVFVMHMGSRKTYDLPFEFDKTTGSAIGKFTIPKDAALGRYGVYLTHSTEAPAVEETSEGEGEDSYEGSYDYSSRKTGEFIVSEYRLPMMKATVKVQGAPLIRPSDVKVDLSAAYLAGGPAKGMKVKLRSNLQPGAFSPEIPGGNQYNFFATPIKSGIGEPEDDSVATKDFLKVQEVTLDANGGALAQVSEIPTVTAVKQLAIEMEYTDPNGEVKTAASRTPVFPADRVIGLKSDDWYSEPGKTTVSGVIVDTSGAPKSGQAYVVEAFQRESYTHRKRLVGGFYSYDRKSETIAIGKVCEGKSDETGRFSCSPKNLPTGSIIFQAKTSDDKGRATYARTQVSIEERGKDSWWVPSDSDRIDLLPEKVRYEPGEKAKLIVRSPFPTSTVLVTIEREGVLDSFVAEVKRDNPAVEIPIKGNYAPNVFVSALALRGRVGDPKPTALLDLARPAMKMGVSEIKVGWKAHELLVTVKPDKTKYRTREKSQVTVQVRTATGEKLPPGSEVALATVDESLLRLKENTSWDILRMMMGQRPLGVTTSTGQSQVVGRRHFGSKAKPPGGGGGMLSGDTRELFEPVIFWEPRLKLDAAGEAKISFPLNDSITSFRVAAIATSGEGYFGDGSATIESSKDLVIYSGFAPLVREGDQIKNAFTLRNTTDKPMKVAIEVTSNGVTNDGKTTSPVVPKTPPVDLKASEAKTIDLPFEVPTDLKEISFRIQAKDTLSGNADAMSAKVRVDPAVPARVLQATLFQLDKSSQIPIKQPFDALPGKGGISIHARASLVSGLAGVKSYMASYPYTCLEQQVSRAIVQEDKADLERLIQGLPSYMDSFGLLKFFPTSQCGSAQLTRYVMNILSANELEIPANSRKKLIEGLDSYIGGKYTCRNWWLDFESRAHDGEAKLLLMETLARYRSFKPKHLSAIQISPNVWANETVVAWHELLSRQTDIPKRAELLKQAENILRARINFQGSSMNLQGVPNDDVRWLLFTSSDQEALGAFGVAIDQPSWGQDAGRMAKGIVARMRHGHWDTTMANAWGVTQFRRFSKKFESQKVAGETKVTAKNQSETVNWKNSPTGGRKFLSWPEGSQKSEVSVRIEHAGTGKPWVHLETSSAIPLKAPFDMGYRISRKVTPVIQEVPGAWRVGDVANVELTITAKADQPWVVVRDPIPAGASHLGTGLSGSSELLDQVPQKNKPTDGVVSWPTEYVEKSHSHFVAYAAYLPRGTYRLNYRVRLNSAGEFKMPPARVEALYTPETFGEVPNANWKVAR